MTVTADFDGVAGNETLTLELAPLGQRAPRLVPLMKLAPAVAPAGQAMPPLAVVPIDPARLRVLLALTLVLPVEEPLAGAAAGDAGTARAAGAGGAAGGSFRWRLLLGREIAERLVLFFCDWRRRRVLHRVVAPGEDGAPGAASGGGVVAGAS